MAYVKTLNGQADTYPYSIGQLRRDNPNTSFPRNVPDSILADYGVVSVTVLDAPAFDEATQTLTQNAMPHEENGAWVLGWTIVNLTADEIAARIAAAGVEVRLQRNALLTASDWTQVADAPVDQAAWATYRQALRDIPQQAYFPHNVNWPIKPEAE